jgi:hypothetical protein
VVDHEVDVGEVGRGAVHVPGLGVLDRLRAERHALVHTDQIDAQLLGLFEDREGHPRVVHPPRIGRSIVVPHVVELERAGVEFADLALHQVQRLASLERVDAAPKHRTVGVAGGQLGAFGPRREPVAVQVGQRQRHRHQHVGVGFRIDHLADVLDGPLPKEFLGRQLRLGVRGQRVVKGVQMVGEHLAGLAEGVLGLEVEHVRDSVEHERVVDHYPSSWVITTWGSRHGDQDKFSLM